MKIGDAIKKFTVKTQDHTIKTEADFQKGRYIFFFYPKNHTPGCTQESCDFRDAYQDICDMGVHVFGISKDAPASHQKFINKHGFPYALLSDETGEMCAQFGVFKEKSIFGKTFLGLERTTFYIVDGIVQYIWKKVSVKGHVDDVIKILKEKA